jgi:hypothetical protein
MKSILLTTTAIVAFAGVAAADENAGVTFGGDFTIGYNDDNDDDNAVVIGDNDGFYWEGDLNVGLSQTLDNGLTAGVSFEFDIVDETNGQETFSDGWTLYLMSDTAGLYWGDTSFAAESLWSSAGDMESDGFSEADGENVLRGEISIAGIDAAVSYALSDADGNATDSGAFTEEVDQLSVAASGTFGMVTIGAAYQEESIAIGGASNYDPNGENGDFNLSEIFGISAGVAVGGADITVAYASDETTGNNSTGIQVAYPFGPVTGTVYYVSEDDGSDEDNYGVTVAYADGPIAVTLDYDYDQGVNKVGIDGSYDVGNGLTVLAGMYDQSDDAGDTDGISNEGTDFYIAGTYDLGGGASVLVSYADAETGGAIGDDEVGGPDYQVGTTVEVSFKF